MSDRARTELALLCLLSFLACDQVDLSEQVGRQPQYPHNLTRFATFSLASADEESGWQAVLMPEDVHAALERVDRRVASELEFIGLRSVSPSTDADLVVTSLAAADSPRALAWGCVEGVWWGYWRSPWMPCTWLGSLDLEPGSGSVVIGLIGRREQTVLFDALLPSALDAPEPSRAPLELPWRTVPVSGQ